MVTVYQEERAHLQRMQNEWKTVDVLTPLEQNEVQVWRLDLSSDLSLLTGYNHHLSAEERERAARRLAGRVRAEFVIGRAALRILLANLLNVVPLDIRFKENSYGKPELDMKRPGPSFNVSHSHGTILIGLVEKGSIGIDVEHMDPSTDLMALAPSVCSAGELAYLTALETDEARRLFFYRRWTMKEAVVKADGRGLSIPLTKFEVPDDDAISFEMKQFVTLHDSSKCYYLNEIGMGSHATGSVATDSPNCRIRQLNFPLPELKEVPVQR